MVMQMGVCIVVHCTSMNNTNRLISSDNKGVASLMMEAWGEEGARSNQSDSQSNQSDSQSNPSDSHSPFVAAFAQANVGDVSPNTLGAFCIDTGLPCQVRFGHY